jgi:hypothetical protein
MKQLNLSELTPQQLKNLLENNQRHGQTEMVHAVLEEMGRRGMATHRMVKWNQGRVRDVMEPFKAVAAGVPGNQLTSYTEAGGLRIGRPKGHPEKMWVDTYSRIKTRRLDASFTCYIKQAGEDQEFQLRVNENTIRRYNADGLDDALSDWRETAARAVD